MVAPHREPEHQDYLVMLRREEVDLDFLEDLLSEYLGDLTLREPVRLPRIGMALAALSREEARLLARDERVLRVIPDRRFRDVLPLDALGGRSARVPFGPGTFSLFGSTLVPAVPENLSRIGVDKVWPCTRGKGVKVAVLDSGVYRDHPQLDVVAGVSFVPDQPDWWSDPRGHGTAVAGILAARESTDSVVVGVAPECDLYVAKVVSDGNEVQPGWLVQGLEWAAAKGVDVVCMSIRPSELDVEAANNADYVAAIDRASGPIFNSGGFLANAAGNTGLSETVPHLRWPATCVRVMAVGALDAAGDRLLITCYGPDDPDRGVEVMAPGWKIDTTAPPGSNGMYSTLTNTSAACPHVAGVAALIKARSPALGPAEVRERLRTSCEDMTPPGGRDEKTGWGRLDAQRAVFPCFLARWLCVLAGLWTRKLQRVKPAALRKTAPIA